MIAQMLKNSNMSLNKFILGLVSTSDGFYCILNPRLQGYGAVLGLSFDHLSYQISKKCITALATSVVVISDLISS